VTMNDRKEGGEVCEICPYGLVLQEGLNFRTSPWTILDSQEIS
jgi:hypothetical protein